MSVLFTPQVDRAVGLVTDEGYSALQAAACCQIPPHWLYRRLKADNITIIRGGDGGTGTPRADRIGAYMLYVAGVPTADISRRYTTPPRTIRGWITTMSMTPVDYTHPRASSTQHLPATPTVTIDGSGAHAPVSFEYTVDRTRVGRGHRLHPFDRTQIQLRLADGWSIRAIARSMGRSPSVISREIRRNQRDDGTYDALTAQHATAGRSRRPKTRKLDADPWLRHIVRTLLNGHVSPLRIAGRLRRWFGTNKTMTLSPETLYQALYVQGAGALRHELSVDYALKTKRTARKPKSKLPTRGRGAKPWIEGAEYSTRPPEAEDRAVPGHWEGDLVIGKDGTTAVVTLIERSSRLFLCRRLPTDHKSATVIDALTDMLAEINRMARSPEAKAKTLTWDQGAEMAQVATLNKRFPDLQVVFCQPHAPWQRPSNENINGELRHFYPKGTDFAKVTDDELHQTQERINDMPRLVLDYATPREVFFGIETGPPVAFTD